MRRDWGDVLRGEDLGDELSEAMQSDETGSMESDSTDRL